MVTQCQHRLALLRSVEFVRRDPDELRVLLQQLLVKIAPPLTISEAALREGLAVLNEAVDEAVAAIDGTRRAEPIAPVAHAR